jgi:K+-transporting ATPase ATPase A chain
MAGPPAPESPGLRRRRTPSIAFNTAVSFVTNTNWQAYGGESTMSHLTQMLGLTVQNFASAAVGMAVAVALVRGMVRRRSTPSATSG